MRNMLDMLSKSGFTQESFIKMLGGETAVNNMMHKTMESAISKILDDLYAEYPTADRNALFIKDPRRSEKEKALETLVSKSLPRILEKMKEGDISYLYEKLQEKKEN